MSTAAHPDPTLRERVRRTARIGAEGVSGASIERWWLEDGSTLVVKRQSPGSDLMMRLLGDTRGRELTLHERGVLDLLPAGVGHAVLGGWVEGDDTLIVMRDLAGHVLTWRDRLDEAGTRDLVHRLADLHAHFAGSPPSDLAPLTVLVTTFAPTRLLPFAATGHPIVAAALEGWELFGSLVPDEVGDAVLGLLADPADLLEALGECTTTLCHGDLSTVNLAREDDGTLTLIDWGQAVAAPGELDVTRLLAGSAPALGLPREAFLEEYRRAAPHSSARGMRLSLLAGLLWLGWNKALDAARHADPDTRAHEQQDLAWWVERGREALEAGW